MKPPHICGGFFLIRMRGKHNKEVHNAGINDSFDRNL